jgi:two-component sensor histidine kinase
MISNFSDLADERLKTLNLREQELSQTLIERDSARAMLKTAMQFANIAIWELNMDTDELKWEGDFASVWGEDALEVLTTGQEAFARITEDDRFITQDIIVESIEQEVPFTHQFKINHPDGTTRWLVGRGNHQMVGSEMILTGISYDITPLKERERNSELLTRELHHRMRNLFATMRAIISLTKSSATSIDDYIERIEARMRALDRAQNVLLNANFMTGSLHALMGEMTSAFPRISWHGPDMPLPENALVSLALVFNELATNAVKYGALSNKSGCVTVKWTVSETAEPGRSPMMTIIWHEKGGPSIGAPPERLGFGSQLIKRSVQDNLKGSIEFSWNDTGLLSTIIMPGYL